MKVAVMWLNRIGIYRGKKWEEEEGKSDKFGDSK